MHSRCRAQEIGFSRHLIDAVLQRLILSGSLKAFVGVPCGGKVFLSICLGLHGIQYQSVAAVRPCFLMRRDSLRGPSPPVKIFAGGGPGEGENAVRPGSPGRLFRSSRPQKGTLPPGLVRFEFFARLWPGPCFIYLNAARCTLAAVCIRHSPTDKARHRCRASHLLFLPQFLYLPYPVVVK